MTLVLPAPKGRSPMLALPQKAKLPSHQGLSSGPQSNSPQARRKPLGDALSPHAGVCWHITTFNKAVAAPSQATGGCAAAAGGPTRRRTSPAQENEQVSSCPNRLQLAQQVKDLRLINLANGELGHGGASRSTEDAVICQRSCPHPQASRSDVVRAIRGTAASNGRVCRTADSIATLRTGQALRSAAVASRDGDVLAAGKVFPAAARRVPAKTAVVSQAINLADACRSSKPSCAARRASKGS